MTYPAPTATEFRDDLAARCFPHRYRRIGSPYAYLDEVGISPILEYIYKGHLIIDVAEAVNVPLSVLNEWIDKKGHRTDVDEAEQKSAEGYLAEGMRLLKTAKTDFEFKKAKEIIRNAQFMAEKKDRKTYGDNKQKGGGSKLSYVFNIGATGDPRQTNAAMRFAGQIIDASTNVEKAKREEEETPSVRLALPAVPGATLRTGEDTGEERIEVMLDTDIPPAQPTLGDMFAHLVDPEDKGLPVPPTGTPRPLNPTPDDPDIGPFYESTQAD